MKNTFLRYVAPILVLLALIGASACAAPTPTPTPEPTPAPTPTPTPAPTPAPPTPPPDTTPPPVITGLAAIGAPDGKVNLSWEQSTAEDFDHYSVYASKSEIVDVTGMTPIHQIADIATNTYEAAELEEGTEYYFAVTAVDKSDNENTQVASVSVTPPLVPKVVRIEETDPAFVYTPGWISEQNPGASGGSWTVTSRGAYGYTDIKVDIEFSGTGISLVHLVAPFGGIADIKIDGEDYPSVDMYAPSTDLRITTIATDLTNSDHILTISPSQDSNPAVSLPEGGPSQPVILIDAVEVTVPQ